MRRTDLNLRPVDKTRLDLGLRFAEFGLPDPIGRLREKGFAFELRGAGTSLHVSFKGAEIAMSWSLNTLEVHDAVPEDADARIVAVIKSIADTAAKVNKILNADKKSVETFSERSVYTGDGAPFAFPDQALFLAECVKDAQDRISIEIRDGSARAKTKAHYAIRVRSLVAQENDDMNYTAFSYQDGIEAPVSFRKIGDEALWQLVDAHRPVYQDAIDALHLDPVHAPPEFDANVLSCWNRLPKDTARSSGGIRTWMTEGSLILQPEDKYGFTLLRIRRSAEDQISIEHGGLDEAVKNALVTHAVHALVNEPTLKPIEKKDTIFDEAARVLLADDAGGYRIS